MPLRDAYAVAARIGAQSLLHEHVSQILRKLNAPNRVEAAAIAHRLLPPHGGRRELES